jgi:hypothetical protein
MSIIVVTMAPTVHGNGHTTDIKKPSTRLGL